MDFHFEEKDDTIKVYVIISNDTFTQRFDIGSYDCMSAHELRRKLIDAGYRLSDFIDRVCD